MLGRLLSGKAIGTDELVVRDTKFLDADENIDWEKWAPNGGRVPGTIKENQTIPAGTIIDRYGYVESSDSNVLLVVEFPKGDMKDGE